MNTEMTEEQNSMSSVYLLNVPTVQKKWFKIYYKIFKLEFEKMECIEYRMLENNIFGENERFINWKSHKNGLIEDFIEDYGLNKQKTDWIKDFLRCAQVDSKDLEYYEIAHNINLIINSFDNAIVKYEKVIEDYYSNNTIDEEWF